MVHSSNGLKEYCTSKPTCFVGPRCPKFIQFHPDRGRFQSPRKTMVLNLVSMAIPGSDLLEVPTIYQAYFLGLCFREYPHYMVQYLHFRILKFPFGIGLQTGIWRFKESGMLIISWKLQFSPIKTITLGPKQWLQLWAMGLFHHIQPQL